MIRRKLMPPESMATISLFCASFEVKKMAEMNTISGLKLLTIQGMKPAKESKMISWTGTLFSTNLSIFSLKSKMTTMDTPIMIVKKKVPRNFFTMYLSSILTWGRFMG